MDTNVRDRQQADRGQSGLSIPGNPKISMIVACYRDRKKILTPLSSFINQTYQNWEAILVHDGDCGLWIGDTLAGLDDPRISYCSTPNRNNDWGNSSKEYGSQLATGEYIGHSNDDNFYVPVYFEWMIRSMIEQQADFAYCNMVHSHRQYQPMSCEPRACMIDGGGWIAKAEIVKSTLWPTNKSDNHADGHYVEALVARCGNIVHLPSYLFVHN